MHRSRTYGMNRSRTYGMHRTDGRPVSTRKEEEMEISQRESKNVEWHLSD